MLRHTIRETLDLLLASVVAALAIGGRSVLDIVYQPLGYGSGIILGSIVGYVMHEYLHRAAAYRVGCRAYFTLWLPGLLVTIGFALLRWLGFGFALILPGYVSVVCPIPVASQSLISVVGPLSNLVLGLLGVAAYVSSGSLFAYGFALINAWIALMNLLPIPPLDGYSIARERPAIWLLMILVSGLLLFYLGF